MWNWEVIRRRFKVFVKAKMEGNKKEKKKSGGKERREAVFGAKADVEESSVSLLPPPNL